MLWWRHAKFGMFVHYGLYSSLEGEYKGKPVGKDGAEWFQNRTGVSDIEYQQISSFRPNEGVTDIWASLAKTAGCDYAVLTSKHHEGFDLFNSTVTEGNYSAPQYIGRDIVREFTDSVRNNGMKVGFYHSVIDWHHSNYDYTQSQQLPYPIQERWRRENNTDQFDKNQTKYIEFLHHQVDELLENYDPEIMWFDFSAVDFDGEKAWGADTLMKHLRKDYPELIVNNRLYRREEAGYSGMGTMDITGELDPKYGDFITPEQDVPEEGIKSVDWESCMTMNNNWGFSKFDHEFKSSKTLVQTLVDVVSKGGNLLLNIGPKPDGSVPEESVKRMQDIGKWMDVNEESIRGTSPSPFHTPPDWGRITQKGDILYVHVFNKPNDTSTLDIPSGAHVKPLSAYLLANGAPVQFAESKDGISLQCPQTLPDPYSSVIKLQVAYQ
ncbi:hypothetical protein TRICI_001077 [Trichomonascus ciferrii]|uniref:alpha-L-fucosidase n=1 Tax=Trichomonascus ciferrii TaxID=44093 RepID=A0A642VAQ3_9ASCO|nr:hypothetical protein TRICI_001077 [Trichomonascus ciferrii]